MCVDRLTGREHDFNRQSASILIYFQKWCPMILPRDILCSPVTYTVKHTGARIRIVTVPWTTRSTYLGWISGIRMPSPVSRQALGSIEPLIKWELGVLSSREKQAGNKLYHLLPVTNAHSYVLTSPYVFMVCCLIKKMDDFIKYILSRSYTNISIPLQLCTYLSFLTCGQADDDHIWSKHVADL